MASFGPRKTVSLSTVDRFLLFGALAMSDEALLVECSAAMAGTGADRRAELRGPEEALVRQKRLGITGLAICLGSRCIYVQPCAIYHHRLSRFQEQARCYIPSE